MCHVAAAIMSHFGDGDLVGGRKCKTAEREFPRSFRRFALPKLSIYFESSSFNPSLGRISRLSLSVPPRSGAAVGDNRRRYQDLLASQLEEEEEEEVRCKPCIYDSYMPITQSRT